MVEIYNEALSVGNESIVKRYSPTRAFPRLFSWERRDLLRSGNMNLIRWVHDHFVLGSDPEMRTDNVLVNQWIVTHLGQDKTGSRSEQ